MKVVYFDCFSGAAGDMILGALVDAGASAADIVAAIEKLALGDVRIGFTEVTKGGLRATKAVVTAPVEPATRTFADIKRIIEDAGLETGVAAKAVHVFDLLAGAEAQAHGRSVEDVHLHEVGRADSIVDIVGCVVALEHLKPIHIACSPLPLGAGTTRGDHGLLPVPGPAVAELLRGVPVVAGGGHETVTPTGAALLVGLSHSFGPAPPMTLGRVGYGAGDRDTELPNVVRVMVGTPARDERDPSRPGEDDEFTRGGGGERVLIMETNLDDLNPEVLPYVLEQLIVAGAQDAWVTPVLMKKGRPGYVLSALARSEDHDRIAEVFFWETTTLGVRVFEADKTALAREWVEVEVEGHPVRVKLGRRGNAVTTAAPEYEDAVKVARTTGLSLRQVYQRAEELARSHLAASSSDLPTTAE